MKILIIEDDDYKEKNISKYVKKRYSECQVTLSVSLAEAIDEIDNNVYELIFVDMAIPSHTAQQGEGAPMSLLTGGVDILLELADMDRNDRCVVLTQYPSIEISGEHYPLEEAPSHFKTLLNCDVLACIHYVEEDLTWINELNKVLDSDESSHS